MTSRIGAGIVVMAAFISAAAVPAHAQFVGSNVGGIVTDGTGAPLADATVTITHSRNGYRLERTTGRWGEYHAVALLPGDYDVTATRSGVSSVTRRITLMVGADATVNLSLPVARMQVQTIVTAEIPLVERSRSQPSAVVTGDQIAELPVPGRSFLVLAQLLPGSGPISSTVNRFAFTRFGGPADQRSGYTTLIDGGEIDDAQWGSPTINVGQDAVQEFKVFRNQFDAQYGHALAAVVAVATRSGTNQWSGSGFYFGQDRALNARNYFASTKPEFDEQRIGGSIGGPIARDRRHVFGVFERQHVDTVRIIAQPAVSPFSSENGIFPAQIDNRTALVKVDVRPNGARSWSLRYAFDSQLSLRASDGVLSDSSQVDIRNRSHSVVFSEHRVLGSAAVNALHVHVLNHELGTTARSGDVAIRRPTGTIGQSNTDSQVVPRTKLVVSDVLYLHTGRHDLKFGGEMAFASQQNDSHIQEYGLFEFGTDAPFDPAVQSTWPTAFSQQKPSTVTYRSRELAFFAQDDWAIGRRIRVNTGLRYDLDLNMRLNAFYSQLLDDPLWSGLDRFIQRDRGTDTNNVQPRLGATWDLTGDGHLVVRGGWGLYVARNRPWFQLRSMNQFESSVIRITDPARLQLYPDISAVRGGRTIDEVFASSTTARQLGTVIPDDFVQPYAMTTTGGVGWRLGPRAALDVDLVHSYGNHQVGTTDRNLPPSGPISGAGALPRPVPQFAQVLTLENYTKSWYDAMETQLRLGTGTARSVQVAYTLSRSYLDGVEFFLTPRGTQRTPHERGYNPTDQRHNLTVTGAMTLPWSIQLGGVLKLASGSPIKVQAGFEMDFDGSSTGDLPAAIPITVGRSRVADSIAALNALLASRNLGPVDPSLLKLDPYRTLDVRLTRAWRLGGNRRIDLLIEGFNVLNHVNFRVPLGNPPNAGSSITGTGSLVRRNARDPRQIQWGLRYAF